MFDKYYVDRSSGPTSVTVTEKRAPTDESVRLLREMESAAKANVLKAVRVENSPIDCVLHQLTDPLTGDIKFRAHIKVNGACIQVDHTSRMFDKPEDIAIALCDSLSQRIAAEVLSKAFESCMRQHW